MLRTAATLLAIMHPAPMPTSPIEAPIHFQKIAEKPIIRQVDLPETKPLDYAPYHYDPIGTHPNAFPPGQCTYGAASMKGNVTWSGNANQWDDAARAKGILVKSEPIVGAIAVDNSGYYGHVAVTIAVSGDMVEVTEMNYDWNGSVRNYWYPKTKFIYIWV